MEKKKKTPIIFSFNRSVRVAGMEMRIHKIDITIIQGERLHLNQIQIS